MVSPAIFLPLPGGDVLLAGTRREVIGTGESMVAVLERFHRDGAHSTEPFDPSPGFNRKFYDHEVSIDSACLAANGDILIAGNLDLNSPTDPQRQMASAARMRPDGSLVWTFAWVPFPIHSTYVVGADGRIFTETPPANAAGARFYRLKY